MEGKSKLFVAARNNDLKSIKHLLEHGANLHADNDGALRKAAENGHLEVFKHLLEQGANSDRISEKILIEVFTSHDLQIKKLTPRLSSLLLKIKSVKKSYKTFLRNKIISSYKERVASLLVILTYHLYYRPSGPGFFQAIEEN